MRVTSALWGGEITNVRSYTWRFRSKCRVSFDKAYKGWSVFYRSHSTRSVVISNWVWKRCISPTAQFFDHPIRCWIDWMLDYKTGFRCVATDAFNGLVSWFVLITGNLAHRESSWWISNWKGTNFSLPRLNSWYTVNGRTSSGNSCEGFFKSSMVWILPEILPWIQKRASGTSGKFGSCVWRIMHKLP